MKADKLSYLQMHDDNSGIEYGVEYTVERSFGDTSERGLVDLICIDKITIPIEELEWFISCLQKIKENHEKKGGGEK